MHSDSSQTEAGGWVREAEHKVERILTRRVLQDRVDGYTLETSKEIVAALSTRPAAVESNATRLDIDPQDGAHTLTPEVIGAIVKGEHRELPPLDDSRRKPSDAVNASVEARLREALMDVCSLFDDEGNFREEHQDHASTALEKAERAVALSTVGVKSEGSPANPDQGLASQHEYPDESRSGRNSSRNQSASSDPTAERGEIVARLLRNARLVTSVDRLRVEIADVEGLALAILAALDRTTSS